MGPFRDRWLAGRAAAAAAMAAAEMAAAEAAEQLKFAGPDVGGRVKGNAGVGFRLGPELLRGVMGRGRMRPSSRLGVLCLAAFAVASAALCVPAALVLRWPLRLVVFAESSENHR